jgi:Tfp pilus assembly protein PilN
MSRRAYFYFILVFVLGVVVGSAATVFYGWYSGRWHHRFDEKRVVHFLRRELKLSDTQTQQVDQIIQQTEAKFRDLQQQAEPQFDAVRNESRDRIRKILNPQQLAKFNELVERFDARRKRHRQH